MKNFKRFVSLILVSALIICACAVLSGCSGKSSESNAAYSVFYCNINANNIISKECYGISDDYTAEEKVEALLAQMFDGADESAGYYSVKPDEVTVNSIYIDDADILTLDFSEEYKSLTNVQEILLRAAVVLTLIQIEQIKGVKFTVEGEAATTATGSEIGIMTADQFAGILVTGEGMFEEQRNLTIYFTNEDGTALVASNIVFYSATNTTISMEEYILQCLIEGPADESGMYRTLENTVVVLSVTTTGDVCYVNFSSSFSEQAQNVSDEIMIYSIVNSLCELNYVSSVQFLIEGELDASFHDVMDLSQPLVSRTELEQTQEE